MLRCNLLDIILTTRRNVNLSDKKIAPLKLSSRKRQLMEVTLTNGDYAISFLESSSKEDTFL